MVYLGFWVLLAVGVLLILPYNVGIFLAYVFAIGALLIVICWRKGEPPGGGPRR